MDFFFITLSALLIITVILFYFFKNFKFKSLTSISERNTKFVNSNINQILNTLSNSEFKVIPNYNEGKITGFFIDVEKGSSLYNDLKYRNLPSTSHEMSIDDFCIFINNYANNKDRYANIIISLMTEHQSRLS